MTRHRARRGLDASTLLHLAMQGDPQPLATSAIPVRPVVEGPMRPLPASLSEDAGRPRRGRRPAYIDIGVLVSALAMGASISSAARAAGVAPRTLHRRAAFDPTLRASIDRGRARLVDAVSFAVARRALAGSVPAARLVLARNERATARRGDTGPTMDDLQAAFVRRERAAGHG